MTGEPRLICNVCHRPLGACDQYLVRFNAQQGATVVHRSLCFPPAREAVEKPGPRAAA
jgi:RNase P subunit RPR2